jgi:hypothetical protein
VSESEAWRTITRIGTGIDRIDAHLSQLEAKVGELASAVSRLTVGQAAAGRPELEERMEEPGGASRETGLASRVGGLLEECGVTDALAIAEVVALYRDHPQWAVWLPVPGGQWGAARPAGSRPPGPEMPMVWVRADTVSELGGRMGQADSSLAPG